MNDLDEEPVTDDPPLASALEALEALKAETEAAIKFCMEWIFSRIFLHFFFVLGILFIP